MRKDSSIANLFEPLAALLSLYLPTSSLQRIYTAYQTAYAAHKWQTRTTGELYITHPLSVATLLAQYRLDEETISAGLLHDVIEDTSLTYQDLVDRFGETIAKLVDSVSKLDQIDFKSKQEADSANFRKIMVAMMHDLRVMLIKLADRLHNMRTLSVLSPEKQRSIATETLEIYTVIAARLGLFQWKNELESIAFQILHPCRFRVLQHRICQAHLWQTRELLHLRQALEERFAQQQLPLSLSLVKRTPYDLSRLIKRKKTSSHVLTQTCYGKLVVPTVNSCYIALGILHTTYKPQWNNFKDHLAIPKANGYQALHTGLLAPSGICIKLQIMTPQMEKIADAGITSYWWEKRRGREDCMQQQTKQWKNLISDLQTRHDQGPTTFLEALKAELCPTELYVFTPKGDIVELPIGATAVDFAYAVHTEIGDHCIAALINRTPAPISTALKNGQTVEVITQSSARPHIAWLKFVTSSRAKLKIRHTLKQIHQQVGLEFGKELLYRALQELGLPQDLTLLTTITLERFKTRTSEDLLIAISANRKGRHLSNPGSSDHQRYRYLSVTMGDVLLSHLRRSRCRLLYVHQLCCTQRALHTPISLRWGDHALRMATHTTTEPSISLFATGKLASASRESFAVSTKLAAATGACSRSPFVEEERSLRDPNLDRGTAQKPPRYHFANTSSPSHSSARETPLMNFDLHVPLDQWLTISPRDKALLSRLGIVSLFEFLFHFPKRYEDWTAVRTAQSLQQEGEMVVLAVTIHPTPVQRSAYNRYLAHDQTGSVSVCFFTGKKRFVHRFSPTEHYLLRGKPTKGRQGWMFWHPQVQPLKHGGIEAIYPSVHGSFQPKWRKWITELFHNLRQAYKTNPLLEALQGLHLPTSSTDVHQLENRTHPHIQYLIQEEFVSHCLVQQMAIERLSQKRSYAIPPAPQWERLFLESLTFSLSTSQELVWREIGYDLSRTQPMARLLQGEVGSGKTVIMALAALRTAAAKKQVLLLTPTTLLATQHHLLFSHWMKPFGIQVELLTGESKARERAHCLAQLMQPAATILIGTHALLQWPDPIPALGLVLVDEQHRFGVSQRIAMLAKGEEGSAPHALYISATPIPRSLSMAYYGHLALSSLRELPKGRKPILTRWFPLTFREPLLLRLQEKIENAKFLGYWICPLIDPSEHRNAAAAEKTYASLQATFKESVALLHGRMPNTTKLAVMEQVRSGAVRLLVSTTAVEVGIDLPDACFMVIENAERLGMAQLHQLRGRVGRSGRQSYCFLLVSPDLSPTAQHRLHTIRTSQNGFHIAEADLAARGKGEWLGTKQSGKTWFRIAQLPTDEGVLSSARQKARQLTREERDRKIAQWFGDSLTYLWS